AWPPARGKQEQATFAMCPFEERGAAIVEASEHRVARFVLPRKCTGPPETNGGKVREARVAKWLEDRMPQVDVGQHQIIAHPGFLELERGILDHPSQTLGRLFFRETPPDYSSLVDVLSERFAQGVVQGSS